MRYVYVCIYIYIYMYMYMHIHIITYTYKHKHIICVMNPSPGHYHRKQLRPVEGLRPSHHAVGEHRRCESPGGREFRGLPFVWRNFPPLNQDSARVEPENCSIRTTPARIGRIYGLRQVRL